MIPSSHRLYKKDFENSDKFTIGNIERYYKKTRDATDARDKSKIDKVLLDRIEQIEVTAYSLSDKIKIFNSHLLKELCLDIDFNLNTIKFPNDVLSYIIDSFTYEAGVRDLKRKIEKILNRENSAFLFKNNFLRLALSLFLFFGSRS